TLPELWHQLEPPITKATLSELDLGKILRNPKLHHEINFSTELRLRPSLSNKRAKMERVRHFWQSFASQLQMFMTNRDAFMAHHGRGQAWCLPMLLTSVKDIMSTLMPTRDHPQLEEGLDIPHIMQQLMYGLFDLEKLVSWLSSVLKYYCAPARDRRVDEMCKQITIGNRNNDVNELVRGMRSLLSVLEAMKFDVANHQLRFLRPILIEKTVMFEYRFFEEKLRSRNIDTTAAKEWYCRMTENKNKHHEGSAEAFGDMDVFFEAVAEMVLPSSSGLIPNTFSFDEKRISALWEDMLDVINLELCMHLYGKLDPAAFEPGASSGPALLLESATDGNSGCQAMPSARSSLVLSPAGSPQASPRLPKMSPSRTASALPRDRKAKSLELYASLISLLQTCPAASHSTERWEALRDTLALQIFSFTDAASSELVLVEAMLDQHLSDTSSILFREIERVVHRRLIQQLHRRVKSFKNLGAMALSTAATGGSPRDRSWTYGNDVGVADIATRLAHLGLLHWRVWGPLVY
ncbi:T-complex protein 11-domain-containing protein, partial [Microdochium bolleyi]